MACSGYVEQWTTGRTEGAAQVLTVPAAAGLKPDTTYVFTGEMCS